ncbi:MAG: hypothetical protein PHN88_09235 [Ignavibacteria bacterium]|nr:hypothetical protein [Ignavibacteria bacterium]
MIDWIKNMLSDNNVASSIRFCLVSFTIIIELVFIAFAVFCFITGKLELLKDFYFIVIIPLVGIYVTGKEWQKNIENKEIK